MRSNRIFEVTTRTDLSTVNAGRTEREIKGASESFLLRAWISAHLSRAVICLHKLDRGTIVTRPPRIKHKHMHRHPDCAVALRWSLLTAAYSSQRVRDLGFPRESVDLDDELRLKETLPFRLDLLLLLLLNLHLTWLLGTDAMVLRFWRTSSAWCFWSCCAAVAPAKRSGNISFALFRLTLF